MKRGQLLLPCLILAFFGGFAFAQPNFDAVTIKTHKVAEGIYALEGEGGNIGVSVGDDGIFLIDDQYAPLTEKILAAIRAISDKPIRFLLNTHWHADHTGGNENFGKAGTLIIAHDNARKRLTTQQFAALLGNRSFPPNPKAALPVITFNDSVTFHINGDELHAWHVPPAHTDGDAFVRFRKANVVHTGDVFASGRYPFIDVENGGSVPGIVAAIDKFLPTIDDNTRVIPGHGPVSGKKEVIAYRNMIATVGKRVEEMVKAGKSVKEVIAAQPTREFDAEWGVRGRKLDAFTEIVYYSYTPYRK